MNVFFDKPIGNRRVSVEVVRDTSEPVRLDLNVESPEFPQGLTTDEAKALGRALIKAAKFAEKGKKP